jgi:SsrA-binding protein
MSSSKSQQPTSRPRERRTIARNRSATHEYLILDEIEAGIVLYGTEVKSLRGGRCSLQEAYCMIRNGELWLMQMHIPEYAQGNIHNHKMVRERKLLAKRMEINKWDRKVREKGTTLIPLEILWDGSLVKLRIGLCKGKKLYDKRQAKRERDDKREMARQAKSDRYDN